MTGDLWTVTYLRYGVTYTAEFTTLTAAVGFACDGEEDWQYAAQQIVGPGGVIIAGRALEEAKQRFVLPELHGDLDESWRP